MTSEIHFYVGQIVRHTRFDYRGVIVDVDGEFEGTEEWYDLVARSRPPRDKPWYHVLVDGSDQMTYVAERHLEVDNTCEPVFHPDVNAFFDEFKNCSYQSRRKIN
jgi:heat shock protein HspQ